MRGEPPRTQIEPDVTLPLPALIPDDYVPDVHQRLVFYKRFARPATRTRCSDLRAELVDRFGEAPDEVDNLSELTLLKIDMRDLRLRALEAGPGRLVVTLGADALLDGPKLAALVQRSKGVYRLTPDMKLVAKVPEGTRGQAPRRRGEEGAARLAHLRDAAGVSPGLSSPWEIRHSWASARSLATRPSFSSSFSHSSSERSSSVGNSRAPTFTVPWLSDSK